MAYDAEWRMNMVFCVLEQGMHELLAPLIFILHCDQQAFLHACEIEPVEYVFIGVIVLFRTRLFAAVLKHAVRCHAMLETNS